MAAKIQAESTVKVTIVLDEQGLKDLKALMQNIHPSYMDNEGLVIFSKGMFEALSEVTK